MLQGFHIKKTTIKTQLFIIIFLHCNDVKIFKVLTKVLCNPNVPDCCFSILELRIGDFDSFCVILLSCFDITLNIVVEMDNSNNVPRKEKMFTKKIFPNLVII